MFLAAALHGKADMIVTANLRDFPAAHLDPHALEAQHPDTFVVGLYDEDGDAMLEAVRNHRAALRNPPRSTRDYLSDLHRLGLSRTVSLLRMHETAI